MSPTNPTSTTSKPLEAYRITRIFWYTVPFVLPGLAVTLLAHFRARALGLPVKRYWVAFAVPAASILGLVLLGAIYGSGGDHTTAVTFSQSQPNDEPQPQPTAVAAPQYLGKLDFDAFCKVNFPDTVSGYVAGTPTGWTCGGKATDGSWVTTVQLSTADLTAACYQQYGGSGADLNEEALNPGGSQATGWGCYHT